jgi:hypothetical protein
MSSNESSIDVCPVAPLFEEVIFENTGTSSALLDT